MDSCSIVNCHRGLGGSSDASFTPRLMMVVASNQAGAGEHEDQTWKIKKNTALGAQFGFHAAENYGCSALFVDFIYI